jgi:RNA polymerase sigma-70 factor (ECF subfamily)
LVAACAQTLQRNALFSLTEPGQSCFSAANEDTHPVRPNDQSSPIQAPPAESAPAAGGLSDPAQWVELHGDCLFRFAMMRLRDATKAEDAVQETFLAALKGGKSFAGRSAERSWLIGILKNKIFDYYRKAGRETSFTDLEFYADEESDRFIPDGLFKDGWLHDRGPQEWSGAGASLDSEVFWKTFRDCLSKLPQKVAAVFNLREVDDVEGKEICAMLNISEGNLWVMLHRARMALRGCLEENWFAKRL